MNVLVLDFWFGEYHRRINSKYVEIISDIAEKVYIANNRGFYKVSRFPENVYYIDIDIQDASASKIKNCINGVANIAKVYNKVKFVLKEIDIIYVMGYDVVTFSLFPFLFPTDKPVYLVQHQHIVKVQNGYKKVLFKTYMNKVRHLLLEEEFKKNFIKSTGVNPDRTFVVHHPLFEIKEQKVNKDNYIIGISTNNDENIVKEIIDRQKEEGFLDDSGVKLILRSRTYEYEDFALKVYNKFLSEKEFEELYENAIAVLTIVRRDFGDRMSGTVMDGFSSKKKIIGIDVPIIKLYEKMNPEIVFSFHNIDELPVLIEKVKNEKVDIKVYDKFLERFSDDTIKNQLRAAFLNLGDL